MKIHVNKKRWNLAILNAFLVLLAVILLIIFVVISGKLDSIHGAERWRGESDLRFAQIGAFLPVDEPKTEEDILAFRHTLDQKMIDASLDASDGTTLYADAYSGQAKLTVSGDHGSAEVNAIGVGGDFFLFHPLQLRSGSYISGDDLMQDRVILDEPLAWQLFGGIDVAGMTVYIQEQPFYVAGVIHRESDFASRQAYGTVPGMFISYSAFEALTEAGITCYEIVMPDMISGFAMSIMEENFQVGSGDLVENSSRYTLGHLGMVIGDFGVRSMRHNGVIYPYWENAVRMTEDWLALILVLIALFAACPMTCLLIAVIKICVRGYKTAAKRLPEAAGNARERRREAQYAKHREK